MGASIGNDDALRAEAARLRVLPLHRATGVVGVRTDARLAQLDHLRLAFVERLQRCQCVVEFFNVAVARRSERHDIFDADFLRPATSFGTPATAGVVHKDLPHQVHGYAEEMRPALPVRQFL